MFAGRGSSASRAKIGCLRCENVKNSFFDLTADHPATHQPIFNHHVESRVHSSHHDGDNAIVAEPVDQPEMQAETIRIRTEAQDFLLCAALRHQIKLICLIDKLDNALLVLCI